MRAIDSLVLSDYPVASTERAIESIFYLHAATRGARMLRWA
jgi:hypothetical protein